jgi:hypothetical protein
VPAGQIYQSSIEVNHERSSHDAEGRPGLMVATPLPRSAGQPGGLLVINLDLERLLGQLRADLPKATSCIWPIAGEISWYTRTRPRPSVLTKDGGC